MTADDPEPPVTSRGADALRRALDSRFETGLPVQRYLAQLAREPAREALVDTLLSMVPDRPDAPRWLRWLTGGPPPFGPDEVLDEAGAPRFDAGLKHPRLRKGQSAGRMADEQGRAVTRLDAQIAAAEAQVADLRRKRDHHDSLARAAVAYGFLDTLIKRLWGMVAMGPAFVLLRAVSDQVVGQHALAAAGGVTDSGVTAQAKAQMEAQAVRETMAKLTGDERYERELYAAIREVTLRHRARAAAMSDEHRRRLWVLAGEDLEAIIDGVAVSGSRRESETPTIVLEDGCI